MTINDFAIIIGAQKCGTTSLYNYLIQHPDIAACRVKEPNFFSRDENWAKGESWYQALWEWDASQHKVALEASQTYSSGPLENTEQVVERLSSLKRSVRLIYIMRDPIAKIESARQHGLHQGWYREDQIPEGEVGERLILGARYASRLDILYQHFGADQILLLQLEEMKRDTASTVHQVIQFLGLDTAYELQGLNKIHNVKGSYRSDTPWRKLTQIRCLKPLAQRIPEEVKAPFRRRLTSSLRPITQSKPCLSSVQKAFIVEALKEDLQRLQGAYGVDISRWSCS